MYFPEKKRIWQRCQSESLHVHWVLHNPVISGPQVTYIKVFLLNGGLVTISSDPTTYAFISKLKGRRKPGGPKERSALKVPHRPHLT